MMNTTSFKDPVLETFLEKAKQMEQVAGTPMKEEKEKPVRKTQAQIINEFN